MPGIVVKRTDGKPFGKDPKQKLDIKEIQIDEIEYYDSEDDLREDFILLADHELVIIEHEEFNELQPSTVELAIAWAKHLSEHGEAFISYLAIYGEYYWEGFTGDYNTFSSEDMNFGGDMVFAQKCFVEHYGEVLAWLTHAIDWSKAADELCQLTGLTTHLTDDGTFYVYHD